MQRYRSSTPASEADSDLTVMPPDPTSNMQGAKDAADSKKSQAPQVPTPPASEADSGVNSVAESLLTPTLMQMMKDMATLSISGVSEDDVTFSRSYKRLMKDMKSLTVSAAGSVPAINKMLAEMASLTVSGKSKSALTLAPARVVNKMMNDMASLSIASGANPDPAVEPTVHGMMQGMALLSLAKKAKASSTQPSTYDHVMQQMSSLSVSQGPEDIDPNVEPVFKKLIDDLTALSIERAEVIDPSLKPIYDQMMIGMSSLSFTETVTDVASVIEPVCDTLVMNMASLSIGHADNTNFMQFTGRQGHTRRFARATRSDDMESVTYTGRPVQVNNERTATYSQEEENRLLFLQAYGAQTYVGTKRKVDWEQEELYEQEQISNQQQIWEQEQYQTKAEVGLLQVNHERAEKRQRTGRTHSKLAYLNWGAF